MIKKLAETKEQLWVTVNNAALSLFFGASTLVANIIYGRYFEDEYDDFITEFDSLRNQLINGSRI